jgi:hypothetical protein
MLRGALYREIAVRKPPVTTVTRYRRSLGSTSTTQGT